MNPSHLHPARYLAPLLGLVWLVSLSGCTSMPPTTMEPISDRPILDPVGTMPEEVEAPAPAAEPFESPPAGSLGTVVRVNETDRYVIVNCQRLPSQGEEATVIRNEWQAGTIRFSGPSHRPFAPADIVTGRPEVGDLVLPQQATPAGGQ